MPFSTLLSIDGINLGDYAARGLTMTWERFGVDLRRAANGALRDLTLPQFRKVRATVSCTDVMAPDFSNAELGSSHLVRFIPELGDSNTTDGALELEMMVTSVNSSRDEWGARTSWDLSLEEV